MFKKSMYAVIACVMTVSLLISGCAQKQAQPDTGSTGIQASKTAEASKPVENAKITFWDENAGPNRTPFYEELIKRFKEKNSDVEVEYVGIPWANAKEKFDLAVAGNEMPNCSGIPFNWISNLVVKGALLPLDNYYSKWSEKDKISAGIIDSVRSNTPDKMLYQLPNTTNIGMLWYRADWVKDAGLNPPQTWNDFFIDAEKLTDKSSNRFGFSIRGGPGGPSQLFEYLYAYSGLTEFFDKNGKSTFNDSKNIEGLKKLVALYNKYTPESDIGNGYKEMVAAFDTGVAGMIQHNLGSYGEHSKSLGEGKFAAAPFPKSVQGYRVLMGGINSGYGIFKSSKNPEAAWNFISFLCNAESQGYWNQNIGQAPTNSDVLSQDWIKNTQHISVALNALADKDTKLIVPPSYLPEWQTIIDKTITPGFQAVLAGKMTPEELLNTWADALTKSKAEYDAANKK